LIALSLKDKKTKVQDTYISLFRLYP